MGISIFFGNENGNGNRHALCSRHKCKSFQVKKAENVKRFLEGIRHGNFLLVVNDLSTFVNGLIETCLKCHKRKS